MSENKHTPEPWKTVFRGDEGGLDIDAFVSNYWGDYVTLALNVGEANARRIVACVNACAGIDTETLESGTRLQALCLVTKQRDELLAALEKYDSAFDGLFAHCLSNGVFNAWNKPIDCTKLNEAHQLAEAAIASVKGGAA